MERGGNKKRNIKNVKKKKKKRRICMSIPRSSERKMAHHLERAFRVNANQPRPMDRMCTVGLTGSPNRISSHAQTMPKRFGPKPWGEKYNTNSQASGSMVRHSAALIRGLFQLVELFSHPASRLFRGHCLDSNAHVPKFRAWEDGYGGVYVLRWTMAALQGVGSRAVSLRDSQEKDTKVGLKHEQ